MLLCKREFKIRGANTHPLDKLWLRFIRALMSASYLCRSKLVRGTRSTSTPARGYDTQTNGNDTLTSGYNTFISKFDPK